MKTNRIIVLMTMLMLATLCACGSQVSSQNDNVEATPEPNPLMKSIRESEIDYLDDVQLFEMVFEEYSIREVIEMRYYSIGEFLYEEGIPDMFLILEELRSQGYSDDIEKLLEIADNIVRALTTLYLLRLSLLVPLHLIMKWNMRLKMRIVIWLGSFCVKSA